jgi:copper chaperone CopZ
MDAKRLMRGQEVEQMKKVSFKVEKNFCEECSLALRRFIGNMDGVESIDVEEGKIAVSFDGEKITEEKLSILTKDSIEKLGYKLEG